MKKQNKETKQEIGSNVEHSADFAKPMLSVVVSLILLLTSCSQDYDYRYRLIGEITSVRIDDDSEYHITTDNILLKDESSLWVLVERKDTTPTLFVMQKKCNSGTCNSYNRGWEDVRVEYKKYKIVIPENYKIDFFSDGF